MTPGGGGGRDAAPDLDALCAEVDRLAATPGEAAAEALAERLAHPSWYLRDRVVAALAARTDGGERLARVLREGTWWARASACDVLARRGDASRTAELLAALEEPNVSLQKSAVRALVAVAARAGTAEVARRVASLEPVRRRRLAVRVAHQAPEWAARLEAELASLPPERFASGGDAPPAVPEEAETRALVRFRRWLRRSPVAGGDAA